MWTSENRSRYERSEQRYPSDLRDDEWARITALIPAARAGGRPRTTDMREFLNAVLYLLRTGCSWRQLPKDFPPWKSVYRILRQFQERCTRRCANTKARRPLPPAVHPENVCRWRLYRRRTRP
ncbi:transposase [Magnetospirillum sulfuroxidans]|uniref:transposase n=1 Tax=Magnetospirillum sulfuroxidans TaxID=611300 RepID=UPI003D161978